MTGQWRCDALQTITSPPATTWHADEAAAVAEETRLLLGGCARAVAWFDSGAEA